MLGLVEAVAVEAVHEVPALGADADLAEAILEPGAEGRDFVYKFDRYGYNKTQHDIAWQGGLTLTF